MKLTIINGCLMKDRASAHDYLAEALDFPGYYGRNLDALADCLSEMTPDDYILIQHAAALRRRLGGYGDSLLTVFQDVCERGGPTVLISER